MLINRKKPLLQSLPSLSLWRWVSLLLIGLLVGSLMASALFIYQYIWRTLNEANSIVALRTEYDYVAVDWEGFVRARATLQSKLNKTAIPRTVRNIFDFASATSSPATKTPLAPARRPRP